MIIYSNRHLVLGIFFLIFSMSIGNSQCDIPNIKQQWQESLLIFEGTACCQLAPKNLIDLHTLKYHIVSFSNIKIYKGNKIVGTIDTLSFIVRDGIGDYLQFEKNRRYLIYAEKDPLSHFFYISQCSRSRLLEESSYDVNYLSKQKDTISEIFYLQHIRTNEK